MSMVEARIYRQHAATSREIAFIDPGVADLGDLLRGLRPEVHAIVLSPAGNPVRQMADALDNRSELRAIHIIAHGAPGEIAFTAGRLSLATISAGARDLARIGAVLDIDGELLLWSCESGRGARGARFIDALSHSTGALVAASTGMVGAAAKGGSWDLDTRLGAAIAPPPLTSDAVQAYRAIMPAPPSTINWLGPVSGSTAQKPSSGSWNTAANWSSGAVPTSSDTVALGGTNAGSAYTVTVDSAALVGALTLSAANGATLDLKANLTASTSITVNSGSTINTTGASGTIALNGGSTGISNSGTIAVTAATLSIVGNLTDNSGGAVTVASGTTLTTSGAVTNSSGATITISGTFTESGTSAVSNAGTITLSGGTLQNTNASAVAINNAGTINSSGTSALTDSNGGITNTGTIHVTGGTLTVTGALTDNSGGALTIDSLAALTTASALTNNSGATITISGTLTETGTAAINNSGGTITLSGGTLQDTHGNGAAAISNSGTINSSGTSALSNSGGGITNTGTIHVTGGTMTVTGALTDNSGGAITIDSLATLTTASALTNNTGATITISGTLTETGGNTAAINNAGTITLSNGTLQDTHTGAGGTAAITNSGTINSSGTSALSDAQSGISNSGNIHVTGGTLTLTGALTDSSGGSIAIDSGAILTTGSALTNNTGATITVSGTLTETGTAAISNAGTITLSGGTLQDTHGAGAAAISNTGTITSSGASTLSDSGGGISNSGQLNVTTGTLTVSGVLTDSGTIGISSGAALTDSSGITLSGGTISGAGTVTGAITASGAAHITASGGTLEIASAITNSGTLALTVGSGASDRLKLDAASTATSLTFSGSTGTLELNSSGTLTLTNLLSVGTNTVQLDGASSSLTDNAGISVSTGTITGQGIITGAITLSGGTITQSGGTLNLTSVTGFGTINGVTGAGTLTASGGTLDLTGTITGATLAIGTVAGSHLTIDGTATTPNAITLNNSNQTLEIGAGHSLTVNADENYAGGTLQIDTGGTLTIGSTHTLTIANGVTLTDSGGTINTSGIGGGIVVNGTLIGTGTINGPLSGSGIVEASGGILHLTSPVTDPTYEIAAGSTLQIDSTIASSNIVFLFLSTLSGELGLSNHNGLIGANTDTISGLDVGTSGAQTNFIDLEGTGGTLTVSSVTYGPGNTSGTVTLSDGTVLNLTNIANGTSGWFVDTVSDGASGTSVFLSDTVCFMPGTRILTPEGEVAVETLKRDDLVTTADGTSKPIRWVGRQTVSRLFADPLRVLPIRIAQGALGETVPSRDLLVSPDHALLVDGVLIQAGALVNGTSIVRESRVPPRFTYYHVELTDHSLILAENTPAETFIDNIDRMAFDNWDEHEALPDAAEIALVEMSYPRAKAYRQVPRATRDRLTRRAEALSGLSEVA